LHEAISREESEAVKAGIITEELNKGFVLGDRVLREI
jgi:molecular chaperone GrpE (heat shock protein)